MKYNNTWDMDSIFNGGSDSPAFYEKVNTLEIQTKDFDKKVKAWNVDADAPNFDYFADILTNNEIISKGIGEARTFMSGLASANTNDTKARTNLNLISNLSKDLSNTNIVLQKKIAFSTILVKKAILIKLIIR